MNPSPVRNVVFDIGRVLIDFSFSPFLDFLRSNGVSWDLETFSEITNYPAYEDGTIGTGQYFSTLRSLINAPISEELLRERFDRIFSPLDGMPELALRLRRNFRVFALSNTNESHYQYVYRNFPLSEMVEKTIASFHVGARKPDPRIFKLAAAELKINPAESVFIDDIEENVSGAIIAGWRGIHHRSLTETSEQLTLLLGEF